MARCLTISLLVILMNLLDDKFLVKSIENNYVYYDSVTTKDVIANDVFFEITDPTELEFTYRLRPAKDFGANFNSSVKIIKKPLVLTNPDDGCSPMTNFKQIKGNVALMNRGECSFLTKTINAEKAGALAAIITEYTVNERDFDYYIEMIHDNSERDTNIPAGFLLGKNGRIIRSTLQRLHRSYAIINLPINLTFVPVHKINHPPWLGW